MFYQITKIHKTKRTLNFVNNKQDNFVESDKSITNVEVWIKKNKKFYYGSFSTNVNLSKTQLIDKARRIAILSKPLKYFYNLPANIKHKTRFLKKCNFDSKSKKVKQQISKLNKNIKIPEAQFSTTTINTNLTNSENLDISFSDNYEYLYLALCYKQKNNDCFYFSIDDSDLDINKAFKEARYKAELYKKTTTLDQINKKNITVGLMPKSSSEFFDIIVNHLNIKQIENHRSLFKLQDINKSIMNNLTIIDNPLKKPFLYKYSDEGIALDSRTLVDKGILKNFLFDYNSYLHYKPLSKKPFGLDYYNLIVFRNKQKYSNDFNYNKYLDLAKKYDIKQLLLIDELIGVHTVDFLTTSFSLKINKAILIKENKIIPITNNFISGKIIDILNDKDLIASDFIERESHSYTPVIISNKIHLV